MKVNDWAVPVAALPHQSAAEEPENTGEPGPKGAGSEDETMPNENAHCSSTCAGSSIYLLWSNHEPALEDTKMNEHLPRCKQENAVSTALALA